MFILAKSFTNKKGEMFLKIFPRQYPSIETAHAAMQSDYQEELKKRHLDRSDEEAILSSYYIDTTEATIYECQDYLNRQKAITEKQLSDLSSGIFLQNFDYIVYGKRLASKSENTVEFVENTIVSHNKQELEVVASGMEAMGLSVETGYYDPDDESSVDVPKQLIGFHYVVLKKNTL